MQFGQHAVIFIDALAMQMYLQLLVTVASYSLQCFDTVGWATGRASDLYKSWVLVCLWWRFDWSFARLCIAPVVTTHHLHHP